MNNEFKLLQLIDSASPTGAFSHSFGMETAFQENTIQSAKDLYDWVRAFLQGSLATTEGYAVYISHQSLDRMLSGECSPASFKQEIIELDQRLFLMKLPKESREGSSKIGKRFLKTVMPLHPASNLAHYEQWIQKGECHGNASIVHGWISRYLEIPRESAVFTYLYACVNNQLQTALRLAITGQSDVQRILKEIYSELNEESERISSASPSVQDMHSCALIQEIESIKHETLYSRLFMS